jgi:phosphoglycerate dehydrogenase-like enzyme
VLVANTPGGSNASGVAEGAVALMLAVLRQVVSMDKCVRDGRYNDRWTIGLHQLWGRTVGLVGFGQIARLVARICGAGFDATVLSYDPFVGRAEMEAAGVTKVDDLVELAARSDVLSVHVPLSDQTRHVVGRDVIAAMKRNAIIVNTSRGGIVDEASLVDALRSRSIAGAGIDVFEREPPDLDNPLLSLDNVILSPHVAGATDAGLRDMAMKVADLIDDTFAGRKPETLVNAAAWEARGA